MFLIFMFSLTFTAVLICGVLFSMRELIMLPVAMVPFLTLISVHAQQVLQKSQAAG